MIKDVFVPSKIGSYYLFPKRVLSFEINAVYVQATLLSFVKDKIVFENSISISLQDQNQISVINAIKKIASMIGKYDEVVTSLTSSAVVFKELTVPFLGKEKIEMVVKYEVEPLLPFSVDEAIIDFIITKEDVASKQTTILVAAVKKTDVDSHTHYFEKSGISLSNITIDMFALYDFYAHIVHNPESKSTDLMIDFAVDAMRLLYFQNGVLKAVRLIPLGVKAIMHKMKDIPEAMQHRLIEMLLKGQTQDQEENSYDHVLQYVIDEFCRQVSLSISFFQRHVKGFTEPSAIICLGAGTGLYEFVEKVSSCLKKPFDVLNIKNSLEKNGIKSSNAIKFNGRYGASLIMPLSASHYGDVNMLSGQQRKNDINLLNKQLLTTFFISIMTIVCLYAYSGFQLRRWDRSYNVSKKEMIRSLEDQMGIDLQGILQERQIVSLAEETLQREKKLWFSFSKQAEHSFLEYLQELTNKIDRSSLGLDLKKMSLSHEEIVLQGKVKDFEALETFEEELMELNNFTIKEKPRELTFLVTLKVKDSLDKK